MLISLGFRVVAAPALVGGILQEEEQERVSAVGLVAAVDLCAVASLVHVGRFLQAPEQERCRHGRRATFLLCVLTEYELQLFLCVKLNTNGCGENERGGHESTPTPSLAILEPGVDGHDGVVQRKCGVVTTTRGATHRTSAG
jgi:hypothetical protein